MDIEGYECKALQQNVVLNKLGKSIPYIFMEWIHHPKKQKICPNKEEWIQSFFNGGYLPFNPGKKGYYFVCTPFYIFITAKMVEVNDIKSWSGMNVVWVHSSVLNDVESSFNISTIL